MFKQFALPATISDIVNLLQVNALILRYGYPIPPFTSPS